MRGDERMRGDEGLREGMRGNESLISTITSLRHYDVTDIYYVVINLYSDITRLLSTQSTIFFGGFFIVAGREKTKGYILLTPDLNILLTTDPNITYSELMYPLVPFYNNNNNAIISLSNSINDINDIYIYIYIYIYIKDFLYRFFIY